MSGFAATETPCRRLPGDRGVTRSDFTLRHRCRPQPCKAQHQEKKPSKKKTRGAKWACRKTPWVSTGTRNHHILVPHTVFGFRANHHCVCKKLGGYFNLGGIFLTNLSMGIGYTDDPRNTHEFFSQLWIAHGYLSTVYPRLDPFDARTARARVTRSLGSRSKYL